MNLDIDKSQEDTGQDSSPPMIAEFMKLIRERRSIRTYERAVPDQTLIDRLIEMAKIPVSRAI